MNRKIRKFLGVISVICFALAAMFALPNAAMAGENGNENPDGSDSYEGCKQTGYGVWTCYGTTWRWYAWPSDNPASVEVPRYTTPNGTAGWYTDGTTVTGCGKYGGYYLHAMVVPATGAQGGAISIGSGAHNEGGFVSAKLGGKMNYRGSSATNGGLDWATVEAKYKALQKAYPDEFTNGWDSESSLKWFCGDSADAYTAKTTSSAGSNKTILVGGTTTLSFDHAAGADSAGRTIGSSVTKSGSWSNSNVNVSVTSEALSASGLTGGSKNPHGYYSASTYNNDYSVTINKTGTYEFCQTITIAGVAVSSSACQTITVIDYKTTSSPGSAVTPSNAGEVTVVGSKDVTFYHSTYATESGVSITSSISRSGDWRADGVSFTETSVSTGETIATSGNASGGWYTASSYANTYKITFSKPGDYKFCETVTIPSPFRTSTSCQTITAVAYYSASSANNDKGSSGTTGIKMTTGTAQEKVLDEVTVAVGDTVYPTFSHKTYSSHAGKNVKAKIEKSEWKSGEADEAWTVEKESGDLSEQTATSQNHKTDGYYLAADRETSKYKVTFNGAGYYTLCETITVNDRASTKVCVKYKAVYNYKNEVSISVNGPVFAGEKITLNGSSTNIIQNNTNYNTTIAKNATVKLVAYTSTGNLTSGGGEKAGSASADLCNMVSKSSSFENGAKCDVVNTATGRELNVGQNNYFNSSDYSVYDTKAGDYICFTLAIYPAKFTGINLTGNEGWAFSNPSCAQIAKRPKFEIHGGSLYSAGSVNTSIAKKRNLLNSATGDYLSGYEFVGFNDNDTKSFGSWVEQGVTTLGLTNGLASGAGAANGTANLDFCEKWTALSFANYSNASFINSICDKKNMVGQSGITVNVADGEELATYWLGKIGGETKEGDITIPRTTGVRGTQVVKTTGDVVIDGNVEYSGDAVSSFAEIPKMIIYAKNITIACHVTRVDAVLIAEETVNTCNDSNVNSETRSTPLLINGAVIAEKLELNRTYGAGTGDSSDVPAEVINYDASLSIWSQNGRTDETTETFVTTYQHELAPRY